MKIKSDLLYLGFSCDKRKRRKQHRRASKNLLNQDGLFNSYSARGTSFHTVSQWHLFNARNLGR